MPLDVSEMLLISEGTSKPLEVIDDLDLRCLLTVVLLVEFDSESGSCTSFLTTIYIIQYTEKNVDRGGDRKDIHVWWSRFYRTLSQLRVCRDKESEILIKI